MSPPLSTLASDMQHTNNNALEMDGVDAMMGIPPGISVHMGETGMEGVSVPPVQDPSSMGETSEVGAASLMSVRAGPGRGAGWGFDSEDIRDDQDGMLSGSPQVSRGQLRELSPDTSLIDLPPAPPLAVPINGPPLGSSSSPPPPPPPRRLHHQFLLLRLPLPRSSVSVHLSFLRRLRLPPPVLPTPLSRSNACFHTSSLPSARASAIPPSPAIALASLV